jgi:hypothetical protein
MKSSLIIKSAGIIAITGACLALTSCGGWSNNLSDPSTADATSCSSLGVTCVTGRLVDDVAYNVNYECGLSSGTKVQSVTGTDGSFSCPAGSLVTFSIINPDHKTDTDKKIVLGQADVISPANLYNASSSSSSSSTPTVYTYLTPRNLASDTSGATSFSTTTINIARLLQTLGRDPNASTEGTPAHRVVLDDNDKRQLTNLAANITLADFGLPAASDPTNPAPGTFDSKVASYLLSLPDPQKHVSISQDAAVAVLQHGIYSFAAGMYTVPGSAVTTSGSGIATAGLSGTDPTYGNLLGTLYR